MQADESMRWMRSHASSRANRFQFIRRLYAHVQQLLFHDRANVGQLRKHSHATRFFLNNSELNVTIHTV